MTGLFLIPLVGAAHAETLTLSYADALSRALSGNPTLQGAGLDLDAADGALLAAKGVFDPSLDGGLGLRSSTSEGSGQVGDYQAETRVLYDNATLSWFAPTGTSLALDWSNSQDNFRYVLTEFDSEFANAQVSTSLQATVSQALLQGWRMSYNLSSVRKAQQNRDVAERALAGTRQDALSDVAKAYWGLWSARAEVAVAERSVELATEEQRVVAAKVAAGALASVEQTRVDALLVQAKSARISAAASERAAADTLLTLLGLEPGADVALATDPAEPVGLHLDEAALVEAALNHNPTLAALKLDEAQARDNLADARHARLPQVNAVASYGVSGYEADFGGAMGELASGDLPNWSVGATISVPLGNRSDKGSALAASAIASSARLDREAYERSLKASVLAQARALETAGAQVELAAVNLKLAEQTLAAERALQDVGRALQKDVLEAIQGVDKAAVALQSARASYAMAIVELEALKGTL